MNVQRHDGGPESVAKTGVGGTLLAPLFHRILDRIDAGLAAGAIEARLPDGQTRILGGRAPGPVAEITLRRWRALWRLVRSGSIGWYQAWERGEWDSPDPVPIFALFMLNRTTLGETGRARGFSRIAKRIDHALRRNDRRGARRNIEFHYDLGNEFYALWLDRTMTYSSALFAEPIDPSEPLETAQTRKIEAMLARVALAPGERLFEIGSGWGGLAEVAAGDHGIDVTGITLSPQQKAFAERRIADAGLSQRARFELVDYRDAQGQYDGLVSVEMVEAVGREYWGDYLAAIHRLLKPGARAAIQFIAIADEIFANYARNADFIQRYIFPGGLLLSERAFRELAEKIGFEWHDRTGFGLHYAETLRRWRERFDAAVEAGRLPQRFDKRFVGLWRYYLMYCEGGFRGGGIDVAQVTLVRK